MNANGTPGLAAESGAGALPFEEAVARLEEVVRELEAGEIPLEAALDRFEDGVRLSRHCLGVLDSAQGRIEQLVGELNGEPVLESVDGEFGV
jgi:exodeoxyribonuclease VII small subunit